MKSNKIRLIKDKKEVLVTTITQVENRYELIKDSMDYYNFMYDIIGENTNDFQIFYNSKNTGETFKKNFLEYPQKDFNNQKEILDYALKNNFKHCATLGIYQENGYYGVKVETENPYNVVANNWIQYGKNQNLYTIFTNNEEDFKRTALLLGEHLNIGFYELTVYDHYDETPVENIQLVGINYNQLINDVFEIAKEYGFTKEEVKEAI